MEKRIRPHQASHFDGSQFYCTSCYVEVSPKFSENDQVVAFNPEVWGSLTNVPAIVKFSMFVDLGVGNSYSYHYFLLFKDGRSAWAREVDLKLKS